MPYEFPIYSPEERIIHSALRNQGVELFIKRDDKIHPFISGNKWRKLKYTLADAQSKGFKQLVTFGGAWSNHLLATAAAAAQFGFQAHAFVRGESVDNPVLGMCQLFGMSLTFVNRTAYKDKVQLFNAYYSSENAYFIDEGGKSALGLAGCAELITELEQRYDYIAVAAGTGTTTAGIKLGIEQQMLPCILQSFPVLKLGDTLQSEFEHWGLSSSQFEIHADYHGKGYAKVHEPLIQFIQNFTQETGIMIEPTYTGKLFYGVFDLIQKGYYPAGSKILLIHTGGLTGLLGHLKHFKQNNNPIIPVNKEDK